MSKQTAAAPEADNTVEAVAPESGLKAPAPRRPVSGTMARVLPPAPASDEPTRVLTPLDPFADAEDDKTEVRSYEEETRVLESARAIPVAAPAPGLDDLAPPVDRPAPRSTTRPTRTAPAVVAPIVVSADDTRVDIAPPAASAVVPAAPERYAGPTPYGEPTLVGQSQPVPRPAARATSTPVDRLLQRAAAQPYTIPVVAMRAAAPSPRLLLAVAAFTALGMLWVLTVVALVWTMLGR